jgi:hypothetical protein
MADREWDRTADERDYRERRRNPSDEEDSRDIRYDRTAERRYWNDRYYDNRQYTNRDYTGRDFSRDDRYRDDQNLDPGSRGPAARDFTHGGSRYPSQSHRSDYTRNVGAQAFGNAGLGFGGPMTAGRYSGVGPKNWQRSDERILEDVNEELTRNSHVDATDVEVSVSGGEVTLNGTVATRHEKREAEDCAWCCPGVKDVHNRLKVNHGIGSMIAHAFRSEERKP